MKVFDLILGDSPIVAAAIHSGHDVRPNVEKLLAISSAERLTEEDPYTDYLAEVAPTRLIGLRSRFEFDLNRPRNEAVYLTPEQAWGLDVWKAPLPAEVVAESLTAYDQFYAAAEATLRTLIAAHDRVVVLDLHSYNHRRGGPDAAPADPVGNPEINIGTGTMDRPEWAPLVDRFIADLRSQEFMGRQLDVRENVRFFGGYFPRWVHQTFPRQVCALAVEFKKFFMDECTGQVDLRQLEALRQVLASTAPGLLQSLDGLR